MDLASNANLVLAWAALSFFASLLTSAHIVLWKRSSKAAVGWIGIVWLAPTIGCALYFLFGINRIARRAHRLRPAPSVGLCALVDGETAGLDRLPPHIKELSQLGRCLTGYPLADGNDVQILFRGEQAFPAMLDAIHSATKSITLSTYIFDRDRVGRQFVEVLQLAVQRGVQVRVLIDSVGARYHLPTVIPLLRKVGVPTATFLPSSWPWEFRYANLRNHRKSLIVDGCVAFIGGMNIREGNDFRLSTRSPICDIQFQIRGPVVHQLQEVFAIDWRFTTGEHLDGECWYGSLQKRGSVLARGVPDGPDEDLDRIRKMLHGALSVAQESIGIVTPYFLPDDALVTALGVAALRGVSIDILLPEKGNLRFVQWAMEAQLWQVLENGCRVWKTPPPFDHAKLMVVDGQWSFIGSANWDPRSLRLNFELNCEFYSEELAQQLQDVVADRKARARPVTLEEMNARPLPVQIRDGVARLFSPYL